MDSGFLGVTHTQNMTHGVLGYLPLLFVFQCDIEDAVTGWAFDLLILILVMQRFA